MMGGLTGRLVAAHPPRELIRIIADYMPSIFETDPALGPTFEPHLPAIAAALSTESLEEFYGDAARMGFTSWVGREAASTDRSASRRRLAFAAAWDASSDDDTLAPWFVDLARTVLWDRTAPLEIQREALEALRGDDRTRPEIITDQLRILRDHSTRPGLRLYVLQALSEQLGDEDFEARRAEIETAFRDVFRNDPSTWVRGAAEDRLREEWPEDD